MVKNQKYKLKCQLSDQKQTPVYFPISEKDKPKENKISLTQKEEIVDRFIVSDIILSVIFLCAYGVLISYDDTYITSIVRGSYDLLISNKPLRGLYVIFLLGGFTTWVIFKNTSNFSEETYTLFALSFIIYCVLFNLGSLILTFHIRTIWNNNVRLQRILPFILLVLKGTSFYLWFLQ